MTPFEHTVKLLQLYQPAGFRSTIDLAARLLPGLPSRTYEEGALVKVNGKRIYRLHRD